MRVEDVGVDYVADFGGEVEEGGRESVGVDSGGRLVTVLSRGLGCYVWS